ncbi:hypothetical protein MKW92_029810 [Papaver armeniacum]|nr:hypothetical protein MKW92_029810 [Papaver armeniacum]
MMSQPYDADPDDQSATELPVVDWRFPVYINGDLTDLEVPKPTSYPYTFDHITAVRQYMFINESKRFFRDHSRKYCLCGSSSSSGFTTGGTPVVIFHPNSKKNTHYTACMDNMKVLRQLHLEIPNLQVLLCIIVKNVTSQFNKRKTPMQVYIKKIWISVWIVR